LGRRRSRRGSRRGRRWREKAREKAKEKAREQEAGKKREEEREEEREKVRVKREKVKNVEKAMTRGRRWPWGVPTYPGAWTANLQLPCGSGLVWKAYFRFLLDDFFREKLVYQGS